MSSAGLWRVLKVATLVAPALGFAVVAQAHDFGRGFGHGKHKHRHGRTVYVEERVIRDVYRPPMVIYTPAYVPYVGPPSININIPLGGSTW